MTFTEICMPIFDRAIADYHRLDDVDQPLHIPFEAGSIEANLYVKCWIDTVQWHLEDIIRDPNIDPVAALALKRRIDKSNQDRTDLVEMIDSYFLARYQDTAVQPFATINTESPAWAIDRLSILALKIWHMREQTERPDATPAHKAACQRKLDVLLLQQLDLSAAIDQLLADIEAGRKYMKVYKQMKMYNDPATNPILYGQKRAAAPCGATSPPLPRAACPSPLRSPVARTSPRAGDGRAPRKEAVCKPNLFPISYLKSNVLSQLLIIRLSAMGDVAMTVPVVTELAQQYPEWHITLLTRRSFLPLFDFAPSNVEVLGINLKEYGGLPGLYRLYALLKKRKFDVVADFHDVLRSKFLRTMFKWSGTRVAVIDKGRAEKKALLGHGRDAEPLKPVMERYRDVLRALDFDVRPTFTRLFQPHEVDFAEVEQRVGKKAEGERWVGIAPLAAHPGKVYSTDSLQLVANRLADEGIRVFAFGAGASERNVLSLWEKENVTSVCGKMGGLHNELLLMSQLDCMVAMDSSNMHMASLCGTPVVSIWGATHPKMGFAPFGQPADLALQDDTLPCRPCSVYGNQPCKLKDYRCLRGITPTRIFDKVMEVLQSSAR